MLEARLHARQRLASNFGHGHRYQCDLFSQGVAFLRGIDTPSLIAQGKQRRSSFFNIDRDIPVVNEAEAIAEHEGTLLSELIIRAVISKVAPEYTAKARMEGLQFSPIVNPSDNWNFEAIVYGRIDDSGGTHGYIPGEIYANVFWYHANNGDEACDLRAGSGQAMRVYEDKSDQERGRV